MDINGNEFNNFLTVLNQNKSTYMSLIRYQWNKILKQITNNKNLTRLTLHKECITIQYEIITTNVKKAIKGNTIRNSNHQEMWKCGEGVRSQTFGSNKGATREIYILFNRLGRFHSIEMQNSLHLIYACKGLWHKISYLLKQFRRKLFIKLLMLFKVES